MTDSPQPSQRQPEVEGGAVSEAERRRRRARVFGQVLPDTTRDERADEAADDGPHGSSSDEWLRRQVPPHHG